MMTHRPCRSTFTLAALTATLSLAPAAFAADVKYNAASGDWDTVANWNAYPNNTDRVFIGSNYISGPETQTVTINTDESAYTIQSINIGGFGGTAGNTGTLNIETGAVLLASASSFVGNWGGASITGIVNHSGGTFTHTTGQMEIGYAGGTYNLSGSGAFTVPSLFIGSGGGAGDFIQTGGTANYTNLYPGYTTTGTYTLSAGTANVSSQLRMGEAGSGTSTFNLSGTGMLNTGAISYVNVNSTGVSTFNQTGGTANFNGGLDLSFNGSGTYNLSGGTMNVTTLNAPNASDDFNLSGGNLVANTLGASLAGKFTMTGGNLDANSVQFSLTNNGGDLSPGLVGVVDTTTLTGNYVQTALGFLEVDVVAPLGTPDSILISGTASLDGGVKVNIASGTPNPGDFWDVLLASGGITDNGLDILSPGHIFTYSIVGGGNVLRLTYVDVIPEPASLSLIALGGAMILGRRRQAASN